MHLRDKITTLLSIDIEAPLYVIKQVRNTTVILCSWIKTIKLSRTVKNVTTIWQEGVVRIPASAEGRFHRNSPVWHGNISHLTPMGIYAYFSISIMNVDTKIPLTKHHRHLKTCDTMIVDVTRLGAALKDIDIYQLCCLYTMIVSMCRFINL